jgi:hypothetical protein
MTDHNDYVASRHTVWQSNVPQTVLDIYFNYVRVLPSWRRSFPAYIPSTIRDVVELTPNKTKIVTENGEYVFMFEERNTLVSAAAEFVKTGVLTLLYNNAPVLHLNVSPPDSDELGKCWVARGIEEFKDGEWVAELTQLYSRLANCETDQKKKDELSQQDELKGVAELKEKFSKLPPVRVEKPSWFRRLWRRSGT